MTRPILRVGCTTLSMDWATVRAVQVEKAVQGFVPSTTVINCPWGLAGGTPSKYLPTGRRIRQGCISPRLCNSFPSSQAKPLLAAPPAAAFSTPARPPRRKGEMINQKLKFQKLLSHVMILATRLANTPQSPFSRRLIAPQKLLPFMVLATRLV